MKYSYHVHSTNSDGKASIKEIVEYAKKIGLDEVGISDHFHIAKNGHAHPWDLTEDLLDNYINEVLSFSNLKNPVVKLGLEVEFIPETVEKIKKTILHKPFDYLIGSVHIVDDEIIDSHTENVEFVNEDIFNKYWSLVKQMAETKVFDIVGHIDLTKKFGYRPKKDISKEIDSALLSIKESDMTVELNTSGLFYPAKEQYPSKEILIKCKNLGIPIIVTADAHIPENLIRGFDIAFKLLKEIGFTKLAYFVQRKRFLTDLII